MITKLILGLSMVFCCIGCIICYELNQTRRKESVMDLIGILGCLFLFAIPVIGIIASQL